MKKQRGLSAIKLSLLSLPCVLLLSCGYGFAPQGEHIDKRIVNIYVAPFVNKTSEAENILRNAFIDQILQGNRFKSVPTLEQADAVINVNIISITTGVLSYRNNILAAEERMTLTLEASLREKDSGKTIWSSQNVVGTSDYKLQDNVNPKPARQQALIKLAKDTAENTFNLMMADF
jgi:outer membrane lipopolysaccharide assembly protein LptE/RlpB